MQRHSIGSLHYLAMALIAAFLVTSFFPVALLADKPAHADPAYGQGWREGCHSAIQSNSPLKALFFSKPFLSQGALAGRKYENGWNVGYTSCRFAQDAVDRWTQTFLLIATLLFVSRNDRM